MNFAPYEQPYESSQLYDFRKEPLNYGKKKKRFPNLIIVLLYGCVTVENLITNLIDYKRGL